MCMLFRRGVGFFFCELCCVSGGCGLFSVVFRQRHLCNEKSWVACMQAHLLCLLFGVCVCVFTWWWQRRTTMRRQAMLLATAAVLAVLVLLPLTLWMSSREDVHPQGVDSLRSPSHHKSPPTNTT